MEKVIETLLRNGFKAVKNPCSGKVEKYYITTRPGLFYAITPEVLEYHLSPGNFRGSGLTETEVLTRIENDIKTENAQFKFN